MPVHVGHFGDERAGPRAAGQRLAVRALRGEDEEQVLDGECEVPRPHLGARRRRRVGAVPPLQALGGRLRLPLTGRRRWDLKRG